MSVNILGQEYDINITTILDLSYKNLTEIPESIGMLSNLKRLDLAHNELTTLPESIGMLSNLEVLSLRMNNLTNLPESIGMLSKLEELYLQYNNLIDITESIGSLPNLQVLYLDNNKLIAINESLTKIKALWLDESSYDFLNFNYNIMILTYNKSNIINLPLIIKKLYLRNGITVDMIKLQGGCDIIRF
jgi:Leucine-rich repeat (LRR) protein